jgi:hypothetical protein
LVRSAPAAMMITKLGRESVVVRGRVWVVRVEGGYSRDQDPAREIFARDVHYENLAQDRAEFAAGGRYAVACAAVAGWECFSGYLKECYKEECVLGKNSRLTMKVVVLGPMGGKQVWFKTSAYKGQRIDVPRLKKNWQSAYMTMIATRLFVSTSVIYITPTITKSPPRVIKAHICIFLRLKLFITLIAMAPPRTAPIEVASMICLSLSIRIEYGLFALSILDPNIRGTNLELLTPNR